MLFRLSSADLINPGANVPGEAFEAELLLLLCQLFTTSAELGREGAGAEVGAGVGVEVNAAVRADTDCR